MAEHLRLFRIALQFLTRLPLPHDQPLGPGDAGRAMLYFPLVGVLIGALLWVIFALFGGADPLVRAAVVVGAWALLTGGLHLDGLADTADAWVGGHGNPERTLAIMKDPNSGPIGVAAVTWVLVTKFAAIAALPSGAWLLLVAVAGRTATLALYLSTPYVRPGGLGHLMHAELPRRSARLVLGAVVVLAVAGFGWIGIGIAIVAIIGLFAYRQRLMLRLGGTTGDTTGALIELSEALLLLLPVL